MKLGEEWISFLNLPNFRKTHILELIYYVDSVRTDIQLTLNK